MDAFTFYIPEEIVNYIRKAYFSYFNTHKASDPSSYFYHPIESTGYTHNKMQRLLVHVSPDSFFRFILVSIVFLHLLTVQVSAYSVSFNASQADV